MFVSVLRGGKRRVGPPHEFLCGYHVGGGFQIVHCLRVRIGVGGHNLGHGGNVKPDVRLAQNGQFRKPLFPLLPRRGQQVTDNQFQIRAAVRNAHQRQCLVALHVNVAHVQRDNALVFLHHAVNLHHAVAGEIKGIVTAHQPAAGTDLKFREMEMLLRQEAIQRRHMVCGERVHFTGRAEAIRVLFQQFLVVDVLQAVHASVHQDRPLHAVAVHDFDRLFRRETVVAVIAVCRQKLEHFPAAPLGFSAADRPQFTPAAIARDHFRQMQMRVDFFHKSASISTICPSLTPFLRGDTGG